MFISSIDNEHIKVINKGVVKSRITNLLLNGPYLEIEGYATFKDIVTLEEDRIRKTLLMVPEVDIEKYRAEHKDIEEDLSDEDIIKEHIIEFPLDNCFLSELKAKLDSESENDLSGFKGTVDLSTIKNGKPLPAGNYNVFIRLEQLLPESDEVKYEKIIPITNIQKFLKNNLLSTKLEYYSAKRVLKYSLILSFDSHSKTLHFKNKRLQSYDPRDLPDYNVAKENRYILAIKKRLFKLFYIFFCILLPINKKKISFASDSRSELNGNFYFIYEELYKRKLNLKIEFIFNERINNKKTLIDLLKTAYHFATSKIILLDDFYPLIYPLRIRKNAELIQVWHAAGAFKTFGYSRLGLPGGPSPRSKNHKNYTKAVVSSEGVRPHYAEGFGITIDKVYPLGVPRADIFFDEEYKDYVRNKLYERYPFINNKKVILFAPTFRGNGQASAYYPFEILNLKELYENLHEEYVFIFKIHPFVNNKLTIPYEYADFFYDLSDHREINDLLLVTDILITDYSSVCFEFALLNKPMLFFAFDVEQYIEERDFYYNYFDFIPGPLVRTTTEIVESIKKEEFDLGKIKPFVKYFFNDTLGKASENVVDQLIIPSLYDELIEEEDEQTALQPPASRIELFERTIQDDDDES